MSMPFRAHLHAQQADRASAGREDPRNSATWS
jgi:hypothetical protein